MSLQQELDAEMEQEMQADASDVVEQEVEQTQEEVVEENAGGENEEDTVKNALGYQDKDAWVASGKDPAKHRSWEEFKEYGQKIPVMQANMKKMLQTISKLEEQNKKAEEIGRQKAIQELSQKQILAAQEENWEEYSKLENEKGRKYQEAVAPQERQIPDELQTQAATEEAKYLQKNPWISQDTEVQDYAAALAYEIGDKYHALTIPQRFAILDKELRQRFPEKFNRSVRQNQQGGVMKSNNGAAKAQSKAGVKSYDSLPSDVKNVFNNYVRKGVYKKEEASEYAKEYWAEMEKDKR